MANTTISPNMNLPIPTVSQDPGPDWANNVDACLFAIDSHNHSNGQGVAISPAGMDINAALPFNGNSLISVKSAQFTAQLSPLTDLDSVYVSGVDLYYTDGSGNHVRITQGGSVTGSTGTITGLPSGTASASYSAGTFTFQSATNTPASMAVGPLVMGAQVANPKTVTISSSASLPANIAFTWPLSLPASDAFLASDNSGNFAFVLPTGTGVVVLSTSPTIATPDISSPAFSGTSTGTIAGGAYTPTVTAGGSGTGQALVANSFTYTRVNNVVEVSGRVSGTTDNAGALEWIITLPVSTISVANSVNGGISPNGGTGLYSNLITRDSSSSASAFLQVHDTNASIVACINFRYQCA